MVLSARCVWIARTGFLFSSHPAHVTRGVSPPRRVTPTLLSSDGGARKFLHATRIKKKRKKRKKGEGGKSDEKERGGNGSEEIKRIKDAQFNRAVAIFCQSYDLFHVFPPLLRPPDKPFCWLCWRICFKPRDRENLESSRGKYAPRS